MRSLVPIYLQLAAGLLRAPPRIGDDGDAAAQAVINPWTGFARRHFQDTG